MSLIVPQTGDGFDYRQRHIGLKRGGVVRSVPDVPDHAEYIAASVAAQLRELRRRNGLTLAQVAAAADVHPSTVHLIEQGKRGVSLATAVRLAQAFNVNLSELVATAEAASPPP